MTPAARTQAAIDLLDAIVAAAADNGAAADTLIARYFAQRRYAGSKDRRAVRELVYAAIRLVGERPASGRTAMVALARTDPAIAETFDGSTHAPVPIEPTEVGATAGTAPTWLIERLSASGLDHAEQAALTGRAPLDVRVNTLRTMPETLAAELIDAQPITGLPNALRLPAGTDLAPFTGRLEVQDAGSQAVTLAAEAQPEQTVIDLCAGAGGKGLALAAAMENRGRIVASDVDRARLRRLEPRAIAAGATIIEPLLLDAGREAEALTALAGAADTVLIDAPCSGTGTWRRNPEARWRLTPARIDRFVATQRHVLAFGAPLVKPGGTLVYIVCSLLDAEGGDQVDAFLADHPGWDAEPLSLPLGRVHGRGVRLTPAHDGSDGFFVARLRAPC